MTSYVLALLGLLVLLLALSGGNINKSMVFFDKSLLLLFSCCCCFLFGLLVEAQIDPRIKQSDEVIEVAGESDSPPELYRPGYRPPKKSGSPSKSQRIAGFKINIIY